MNVKVKGLKQHSCLQSKNEQNSTCQNVKKSVQKHSGTWKNCLNSLNIFFQCCKPPIKKKKKEKKKERGETCLRVSAEVFSFIIYL